MDVPEPSDAEALARVAALVRTTVRDTDGLWSDGPGSLVLVLVDVDGPNSEPALARLRLRLRREGFGAARMGRASPAPGIGTSEREPRVAPDDARPAPEDRWTPPPGTRERPPGRLRQRGRPGES